MHDPDTAGGLRARTRRDVLTGALGAAAALGLARAAPAAAQATAPDAPAVSRGKTRIVVLGSQGGQQITQLTGANLRCGTSVLIDVGGELTVLDCGCGSVHRLTEAGYDANRVRNVLITHCHADHVAELGGLASFAWSSGRNGVDRERRLDIYGPTGIEDYRSGLRRSLRRSIADQEGPLAQRPRFDRFAFWHEFAPPRRSVTVLKDAQLEVRAIRVHHGTIPAVGYRVRTPDLDIAFSGDRGNRGDGFTAFARGADVLFHEVIHRALVVAAQEQQKAAPSFIEHLIDDHTDAADAGRIARSARVGTLVLYHLIPGSPGITDEAWTALVRPQFAGRIIVARDLLVV